MRVQRIRLGTHQYTWLVLGDDYLPVKPIETFLRYLQHTEKSPNTVRAYANHLKLFWEYLSIKHYDWNKITIENLANFIYWLRSERTNVIARCKEITVNTILSALSSFYRYHNQLGNTAIYLTEASYLPANKYKSLLYHIYKGRPVHKRIISLKCPRTLLPNVLGKDQILQILDACTNHRDRFLISLLYETGLRIGQALALRHTDIKSWDNEIHIIFRKDNENNTRNKSMQPNVIHVSSALMQMYNQYVIADYEDNNVEFVFINYLTNKPLCYDGVRQMFSRLSKKINKHITPHMLRHTHATELIRNGWDAAFVQKRLGHSSVQTTVNTYMHINQEDMKRAFQRYQAKRNSKKMEEVS